MTTQAQDQILATICTRDEAGRHFTEIYSDADLAALEQAGLIEIHRPVHPETGIQYSEEHWTVEVTEDGLAIVEAM